jgi:hypothetical protein
MTEFFFNGFTEIFINVMTYSQIHLHVLEFLMFVQRAYFGHLITFIPLLVANMEDLSAMECLLVNNSHLRPSSISMDHHGTPNNVRYGNVTFRTTTKVRQIQDGLTMPYNHGGNYDLLLKPFFTPDASINKYTSGDSNLRHLQDPQTPVRFSSSSSSSSSTVANAGTPLPMDRGPLPMDRGPLPMDRGPLPMDRAPLPMDRAPLPMDRAPLPMDRAPLPMDRAPLPMDRAPLPMDRAPLPMDRAPLPMDRAPKRSLAPSTRRNARRKLVYPAICKRPCYREDPTLWNQLPMRRSSKEWQSLEVELLFS